MRRPAVVVAALSLTACSGQAPAGNASANASASATASTVATASGAGSSAAASTISSSAAGVARQVKEENDLYSFEYSYPAAAGGIPGLKTWLDADLDKTRKSLAADAREGRDEAKKDDFPFHAYDTTEEWKVVTDLPNWLSLSSETYTFSGGAHGNTAFDALLWDKAANTRRAPLDLFTSPAALSAAIRKPFCAGLDKERAKKREGFDGGSGLSEFDSCIDPVKETVILGSAGHAAFDRIGVLVPPYEAGPYAEGTYEVTVPVTPAVLAAVKPQYRAAFAAHP